MAAFRASMGNALQVQLSECFSYITSSPPPVVDWLPPPGPHPCRNPIIMPWFGVVLRRWTNEARTEWRRTRQDWSFTLAEFCVHFDYRRGVYELPKSRIRMAWDSSPFGTAALLEQQGLLRGVYDSSPFGTARWALWEKTGVWVAWRAAGRYTWLSDGGELLPLGPSLQCTDGRLNGGNAWVCTDLAPEDAVSGVEGHGPVWLTREEFEANSDLLDHATLGVFLQLLDKAAWCDVEWRPLDRSVLRGPDFTSASSGDQYASGDQRYGEN